MHLFCRDLGISTLDILFEKMKMDIRQWQIQPQYMIFILELLLSFLLLVQEESNKHFNSIKIICEQQSLMTQNKLDYSKEMIFSLLFYNCSSKWHRMLRNRRNIILTTYSTIKRQILSTSMNPLIKQHDNNFFIYIKNKFTLLVQKNTTVSLFADEIHPKPYFDYKGANILG